MEAMNERYSEIRLNMDCSSTKKQNHRIAACRVHVLCIHGAVYPHYRAKMGRESITSAIDKTGIESSLRERNRHLAYSMLRKCQRLAQPPGEHPSTLPQRGRSFPALKSCVDLSKFEGSAWAFEWTLTM